MDYRHINHSWFNDFVSNPIINNSVYSQLNITQLLYKILQETFREVVSSKYNASQIGFFDYVFSLANTTSCITNSLLEFYIATRLNISNIIEVICTCKEYNTPGSINRTNLYPLLNLGITHWCLQIDQTCNHRFIDDHKAVLYINNNAYYIFLIFIIENFTRFKHLIDNYDIDIFIKDSYSILFKFVMLNLFNSINSYDDIINIIKIAPYTVAFFPTNWEKEYTENSFPEKLIYNNLLLYAIYYGVSLQYIAENIRTRSHELIAVNNNGSDIKFVSVHLQSDRIIQLIAVRNDSLAIEVMIANKTIDKNDMILLLIVLLQIAFKDIISWSNLYEQIENSSGPFGSLIKTKIQTNPNGILNIVYFYLKELIPPELDILELDNDPQDIITPPEKLTLEKQQILDAVCKNPLELEKFKKYQNDREIVLVAILRDGMALKFASSDLKKDPIIVLVAVLKNGLALQFADDDILKKNWDITFIALTQNIEAKQYMHTELTQKAELNTALQWKNKKKMPINFKTQIPIIL